MTNNNSGKIGPGSPRSDLYLPERCATSFGAVFAASEAEVESVT